MDRGATDACLAPFLRHLEQTNGWNVYTVRHGPNHGATQSNSLLESGKRCNAMQCSAGAMQCNAPPARQDYHARTHIHLAKNIETENRTRDLLRVKQSS